MLNRYLILTKIVYILLLHLLSLSMEVRDKALHFVVFITEIPQLFEGCASLRLAHILILSL